MNRHVVAGVLGLALALAGCMSDRRGSETARPDRTGGPPGCRRCPRSMNRSIRRIRGLIRSRCGRIALPRRLPKRPSPHAAVPRLTCRSRPLSCRRKPPWLQEFRRQLVRVACSLRAGRTCRSAERGRGAGCPGVAPRADEPGAPPAGPASVAEAESTPLLRAKSPPRRLRSPRPRRLHQAKRLRARPLRSPSPRRLHQVQEPAAPLLLPRPRRLHQARSPPCRLRSPNPRRLHQPRARTPAPVVTRLEVPESRAVFGGGARPPVPSGSTKRRRTWRIPFLPSNRPRPRRSLPRNREPCRRRSERNLVARVSFRQRPEPVPTSPPTCRGPTRQRTPRRRAAWPRADRFPTKPGSFKPGRVRAVSAGRGTDLAA